MGVGRFSYNKGGGRVYHAQRRLAEPDKWTLVYMSSPESSRSMQTQLTDFIPGWISIGIITNVASSSVKQPVKSRMHSGGGCDNQATASQLDLPMTYPASPLETAATPASRPIQKTPGMQECFFPNWDELSAGQLRVVLRV